MKKPLIILLIILLLLGLITFLFFGGFFKSLYSSNSSGKDSQYKAPNYTLNSDGTTVSDNANKLMWQKNSNQERVNWNEAIEYCNSLNLSEFNDWRLPSQEELLLLYDSSKNDFFWSQDYNLNGYWSNTTVSDNPNFAYGFRIEKHDSERDKSDAWYFVALCVRSQ